MFKSIGEILKKTRERKKITYDEVYKATKINPIFIKALENDTYGVFSSKVHSKGFLKVYCEFLGINEGEILALWRREYEKEFDLNHKENYKARKFMEVPRLIITPSFLVVTFGILIIFGFFGYLYYQYRSFTGEPNLTINYPPDNLLTQSAILDITGKTDIDAQVYINSEKLIQGLDGSFAQSVRLNEGLNTIGITAKNKYGKEKTVVKTIIFRPVEVPAVVGTTQPGDLLVGGTGPDGNPIISGTNP